MRSKVVPALASLLSLASLAAPGAALGAAEDDSKILVDKEKRTVIVPARVAPRKIDDPRYKEIYPVEVVATFPFPRGKKSHETVVTIEARPSDVHKALEGLGLKAGKPARTATDTATGPVVKIFLEVGKKRVPINRLLVDRRTNLPLKENVKWLFTGSALAKPDPDKEELVYGADSSGTLISVFPVTDETVFQSSLGLEDEKYVKLDTNKALLPAEGKPVRLVIVALEAK